MQIYLGLVAFSLLGSLASRVSHSDPGPIARPVALLTLAAANCAAFVPIFKTEGKKALAALAAVWAIGAAAELIGLSTGDPFGRYHYTDRWWPVAKIPSVGNYPLQLPFAWTLIVGSAYFIAAARSNRTSIWVAALLATCADQAMEPTMTRVLRYWTWSDSGPMPGGTPVTNAAGWFVVSLIAAWAMRAVLGNKPPSAAAPAMVLAAYLVLVLGLGALQL